MTIFSLSTPRSSRPRAERTVAVFVAHGMGQQIPFQTMDAVAHGLHGLDSSGAPTTRAVKHGDEWLSRIELPMADGEVDVHIYEAYWAPLTEGRITLRNVMRFLLGAGVNGLRNARAGTFKRWAFGSYEEWAIPVRVLMYLLITLGTIAGLVVMNSAIAAVAAGTTILGTRPEWLTPGLMADLTTTFNGVVVALAAAAVFLGAGVAMRRRVPHGVNVVWSWLTTAVIALSVFAIVLGGAAIVTLFDAHVRRGIPEAARLWDRVLPAASVHAFDAIVATRLFQLVLVVAGIVALVWAIQVVRGLVRDLTSRSGALGTVAVTLVTLALGWMTWQLVEALRAAGAWFPGTPPVMQAGFVWALLVAASAVIRQVLVQFIGDVAIYVMPYKLDAFNDLRREIRQVGFKVLNAIFSMKEGGRPAYDQVIVVGHSLGSVVAYDALNQMIREDVEANGALRVVQRTRLLLTFGSPLDKTAFIFTLQGRGTSEAREALAASVQPMISSYHYRPTEWVNIYTPWDIISGSLEFYDEPGTKDPKAVKNFVDPEAMTPIVAHTEYWSNPLVYRRIYAAIRTPDGVGVALPADWQLRAADAAATKS